MVRAVEHIDIESKLPVSEMNISDENQILYIPITSSIMIKITNNKYIFFGCYTKVTIN